jgi:hypothetical protein
MLKRFFACVFCATNQQTKTRPEHKLQFKLQANGSCEIAGAAAAT